MIKFLKENNYEYYKNYQLNKITTIKNKGICKYYIVINNFNELYNLVDYLKENKKKYLIIGNGSKLVFVKNYYGIIISLKKLNRIKIGELVEVESGCLLINLINKLKKVNLGGIEKLIGVPAGIGGALINNVSAHNCLLSDFLVKVIVYQDGKIRELLKEEIIFRYRYSSLKDCIILKCYFKFFDIDKDEIEKRIKEYKEYRIIHQVVSLPNIGSVFKNNKKSAAMIIKDCKLENFKYKNVSFSKKHLNFLMIRGKVNGKYIHKFVEKVRKKVYLATKINLESEIIFIK